MKSSIPIATVNFQFSNVRSTLCGSSAIVLTQKQRQSMSKLILHVYTIPNKQTTTVDRLIRGKGKDSW